MTHMRSTALASPHDHRSSRSSSSSSSSSNSDHRCFVTCMDDACERCLSACLTCGCLKTLRRRAQQVFAGVSCLQFASICTRCSLSHVRCPSVHNPPPPPLPPPPSHSGACISPLLFSSAAALDSTAFPFIHPSTASIAIIIVITIVVVVIIIIVAITAIQRLLCTTHIPLSLCLLSALHTCAVFSCM